jgi:hypothetical protein
MYTLVRRFHVLHSDPVQIPHRTTTMGTQCMHTGTTGRPVRLRPVAGISLLWYEETYARSRPGRTSVKWPPIRHHVSRAEGAVGGSLLLTHASFCRLFAAVSETHWPGPLIRYRTSVSQRFFPHFPVRCGIDAVHRALGFVNRTSVLVSASSIGIGRTDTRRQRHSVE